VGSWKPPGGVDASRAFVDPPAGTRIYSAARAARNATQRLRRFRHGELATVEVTEEATRFIDEVSDACVPNNLGCLATAVNFSSATASAASSEVAVRKYCSNHKIYTPPGKADRAWRSWTLVRSRSAVPWRCRPLGRVVRPEAVFEGKVSDFVIRHTYRMMFADYQQRKYDWPSLMLRILMIHRLTAGVAVYGAIAGRRVL
jgi:hypothetical protein